MIQYEYQIRFDTPAFLGNADQTGQWRTPPFKALLRQWWRVAFAAGRHSAVDVDAMRREEGLLFGVAADGREGSRKSRIRIRLDRWDVGSETRSKWGHQELTANTKVKHPEVGPLIGPLLYLGYGPLEVSKVTQGGKPPAFATVLKKNAAIQHGETARLSLAFPDKAEEQIKTALWLIDHYGTLGGRSRNGWGSLSLTPINDSSPKLDGSLDSALLHDWRRALHLDWPHAIGRDESQPLIWRTPACSDWKALMRHLAEIKIGLRTQFKFPNNVKPPHHNPLDRHWLSYPITRHGVRGWGNARLPNSLRFKVRRDDKGNLYGVIVHVPCAPPPDFRPNLAAIQQVWLQVHRFLDDPAQGLTRIPV
jgi:CRISPR-associated protein Cmr1